MSRGLRKGFTLIELLIVVAIIAILAAIAVPNFLEAQVRAKVSRCRADIRSVVVAIEAYTVDYNQYPNIDVFRKAIINYGQSKLLARLIPLTTPVAYLTSIPKDPFNQGWDIFSTDGNNVLTYGVSDDYSWPVGVMDTYAKATGYPGHPKWVVFSYGPLMNPFGWATGTTTAGTTPWYLDTVYDPTNGTVSPGIIARVGP